MGNGFRNGLLRLAERADQVTDVLFGARADRSLARGEEASDHELRDIGLLDGRVSPSTVERVVRPDAWDIVEQSPRWL